MTYCPVWDYYTPTPGSPALIILCTNQNPEHVTHYTELTMYGSAGSVHIIKDNRSKEAQHG